VTRPDRGRQRSRDARGFTLLEVMVALAVIATAFTALLGLHVRNLKLAARDQAYTQALLLSRSLISEAELGPYPEVGVAQGDFEDRWPGRYTGFRWLRTVSDFSVLTVRQVTIRVIPYDDESAASELTVFVRPKPS
jgi:general secretion pathway protein I